MPGNAFRGITFHVVGGNLVIERLFLSEGGKARGLTGADIIVFQGGTDIDPRMYNEDRHPRTDDPDTRRDRMEYALYHNLDSKQYKIGICRGAQFLNICNGGRLWQHIEGHRAQHAVIYVTEDNIERVYNVSSTHHQMMIPSIREEKFIWSWACESDERQYPNGRTIRLPAEHWRDPEVIYYPRSSSLCFQPHPEYDMPKQTKELFLRCVNRMIET